MKKVTEFFSSVWNTFKANAASMIAAMIAGSLLTVLATSTADAQTTNPNCGSYEEVSNGLQSIYGEQRAVATLDANEGVVVEFWGNTDSGSFSFVVVNPNGIACIISAGNSFDVFGIGAPA